MQDEAELPKNSMYDT